MPDTTTDLAPTHLRCEYLTDPLGVGELHPRLSWEPVAATRGRQQSAYQIRVATGAEQDVEQNVVWDTGKVSSRDSFGIAYGGPALESRQQYQWQVRLWDERGHVSAYSPAASWEMSLLPTEWRGVWITVDDEALPGVEEPTDSTEQIFDVHRGMEPCPFLRRTFSVEGAVRSARVYVSARGLYEFYLNGQRVHDTLLEPGWTDYNERVQYQTFDITPFLRRGLNCAGAVIADGWYSGYVGFSPKQRGFLYGRRAGLLAQLHIELEDGRVQVVPTDEAWRSSFGPLRFADMMMGQGIDHRHHLGAWAEPEYDDAGWFPVHMSARTDVPLVASSAPPVRVVDELEPADIWESEPGVLIVDFGQNAVGFLRLEASGRAGTRIAVRHAEACTPDGHLYTANLRGAAQTDLFVLGGAGREVFEPRFTFHGFRYAEIRGYPGELQANAVTFRVISTDTPDAGSFSCSNDLVNRLQSNIRWGQRSNYVSVPTDCPQRDERLGWTADTQIFLRTGTFNADLASFLSKWMRDLADAQSPEGGFPDVAPRASVYRNGAPAWGDAGIIVPWTLWRVYGDARVINEHWQAMERWMAYIRSANPDLLRSQRLNNNYGDWLNLGAPTPKPLLATAYWAYCAKLMAEMAAATGRSREREAYSALTQGISERFVETYIGDDGRLEGDTQTGYLLALGMDLLPPHLKPKAAEHLLRTLAERNDHLSTGFIGVRLLCPVLSEIGRSDLAYKLLLQDSYPSWGYSIRQGATTVWERWDGWTEERGFQTPNMNSLNHYSLGSVGEWLYRYAAGIDQLPDSVGYSQILLRPQVDASLNWVRAHYHSVRGVIASGWRREKGTVQFDVTVPTNTSATMHLPADGPERVSESGRVLSEAKGVRLLGMEAGGLSLMLESGRYSFKVMGIR